MAFSHRIIPNFHVIIDIIAVIEGNPQEAHMANPTNSEKKNPSNHIPHNHGAYADKRQRGTLRRRIQAGMFYSTLLAMLILLAMLVPLLYTLSIPLSSVFSHSVTNDINMRANTMMSSPNGMGQPPEKKGVNANQLKQLSLEEILTYANTMYNDKTEFDLMSKEAMISETMMVKALDENTSKVIITSILSAFSDFEGRFPVRAFTGQDLLLVEYSDGQGNKLLCLPINASKLSIAQYEERQESDLPFIKSFFHLTKSTLTIVDENDTPVGKITVALNPFFIYGISTVIIVVMICAVLFTLPIIALLTRFHAKNIIKPIDQLNKQMASLAQNDFYGINDFHFSVKRPPRELVTLMNSTTQIMEHMNDQNQELDAQKKELEAQNTELEAQNMTLSESRDTIQSQQDQLVRSEKMATLGQISAAIAHEINTPLGAIKSNVQMMQMVLETTDFSSCPPDIEKRLNKLRDMNAISNDASNRVTDIIKSLKNFSRVDQADFQDYNPVEGIESVLVLTSNLWKNHVEISKDYQSTRQVLGYAGMLNQVLMNIVVNAIHAMPEGGRLNISTASDDTFYTMTFKDSGTGIALEFLEKVFESGFTTKDASMGTGLGLAISKGIIDKHKGIIYAVNNEGEPGASFVVKLPLTPPQQ